MTKDYDFYVSSDIDINNINSDRVPNYKKRRQERENRRQERNKLFLKKFISLVLVFTISGVAADKVIDKWPSIMEELLSFSDEYDSNFNYGNGNNENIYQGYDSAFISDVGELYDDATTYVSDLYKTLDLDSSLECFYVYNYLDDQGLLSLDNNDFNRENKKYMDLYLIGMLGADIMYEKSVCRHEADFYVNTLNKYGIDAIASTCFMGNANHKNTIKGPNHEIVVVNDNGVVTYQDTLNNVIFDKYDLSQDNVVFEQNFNTFCYMMPEFSKEPNVLCTQNNDTQVTELKKWITYDDDGVDISYIDKEFKEAQEKIDNNTSSIAEFEYTYTNNIKNKLPAK